jgi:TonB dependent receptor-like, beta-barrel
VEIPGAASIGTEPFAPADRVEKRWQISNNLSRLRAAHTYKAGVDFNIIPATATFPLNQAGLYSFPTTLSVEFPMISAVLGRQLAAALKASGAPDFTAVQLYGMGLPESFVQQFGGSSRATAHYRNTTLGVFFQDSWKVAANFMLNYGIRYEAEYATRRAASSSLFQQSEELLGVGQYLPRDNNNIAPRLGFSWDPFTSGKTVLRGSYGLYYGHPLTALSFLSDIVDGADSPFLVSSQLTGVEDLFQGRALTPIGSNLLEPGLGYQPDQQRYDPLSPAFLSADSALFLSPVLPTTLPIERQFRYTSSQQATLGIEREFADDWAVSADYIFLRGLHIPRPRNINQGNFDLIAAYERAARVCPALPGVSNAGCANPVYGNAGGSLAGLWDALGGNGATSLAPFGQLIFNQFRASGPNYAYSQTLSGGTLSEPALDSLAAQFGLPLAPSNQFVPFFNVKQYESSASSFYHGVTLTVRKRMSRHYQILGSWTWSHSIDDATDIQTFEEPQDNSQVRLDRGNSNFDQRHRVVVIGILEAPASRPGGSFWRTLCADWTLAPRIEVGSGRPFRLLTRTDRTLVNSSSTARPNVVPLGTPGSYASPDGEAGLSIPDLGAVGNLGRNVYNTSGYQAVDLRLTRRIQIGERIRLNLTTDVFNLFNRVNIQKVDTAFTQSGRPVSSFNPRQIQFGVRILF